MQRSSFEYRQLVTNYYSIVRNIINAPLNSHDFIRWPLKSLRLCRTIGVVRRSRKRRCISWKARDISEVGERSFDEAAGNARNRDRVTYLNTTRRVLAQFYAAIGERCAGLFTATGSGRREEKRRICRSYGNRAARQAQPVSRKKKRKKKKEKKEKNGQGGKMREKRRKRGGIVTRDLKSTTEIFEIDDSYASTRRRMGKRCAVKTAFAHRHRPFSIVVASLIRRPTTTDRNLVIRQRNTISDFSFRARCLSRSRCFFRSRLSVRRFIR